MVRGRGVTPVCPWAAWLGFLGVVALFFQPAAVRADDVPDEVRAAYDLGRKLLAKGDRASLEKALRALDARKAEALDSVDYWEVFARVWLGLKKGDQGLWQGVVAPLQQAAPGSPVFDLVHARLETDHGKRGEYIAAALERRPKSLRSRVAKAVLLLDREEEDEADALLEEILEVDPYNEGALGAKARLSLSDGLPGEAIEYLDKALEKHPSAALYHTKALCYRRKAQTDSDVLDKALEAAAQALGLDPTPEHVKTFDELLKETGDAETAAKALKEHFERTRLPLLGALLAESAFRAGDYETTILGLSAATGSDPGTLKGLAVSYARLGKAGLARQAAQKVLSVDSRGVLFAARIDLLLGDAEAVHKRLGALADADALKLRAEAHAWAGQADAVQTLLAKKAASGTREGEDALIALLQARLIERMDPALAEGVRQKVLAARWAAGAKTLAQADFEGGDLGTAKTQGWVLRAVTYWRAPCGRTWRPTSEEGNFGRTFFVDGDANIPTVADSIDAESDCPEHKRGSFHFNKKKSSSPQGFIELFGDREKLADFKPAQQAFAAGCAACVTGKAEEAADAFLKALNVEPAWHRARVLRFVMQALGPEAEKRDAARDAAKALEDWPDDFELRRLVIFLRAWAGDAELEKEIEALAEREAKYNVRSLTAL